MKAREAILTTLAALKEFGIDHPFAPILRNLKMGFNFQIYLRDSEVEKGPILADYLRDKGLLVTIDPKKYGNFVVSGFEEPEIELAPEPLLTQIKAVDPAKLIRVGNYSRRRLSKTKKFVLGELVKTKHKRIHKYYYVASWHTPGCSGYFLMRDDGKLSSPTSVRKMCEEFDYQEI